MRIKSYRLLSQVIFLFLSIIGVAGVAVTGLIFPYFFCNASPGAVCACPIWVLEHSAILMRLNFVDAIAMLLFFLGFLGVIGFFVGRSFCGWACPIGFIQDLAKPFRGKIKPKLGTSIGIFIFGCILISTPILFPTMITGYLGIAGVVVGALGLYGILTKLDNIYVNLIIIDLAILGMILIRTFLKDQPGIREVWFFITIIILFVSILVIIQKYVLSRQSAVRDSRFYYKNRYYKIKYVILLLIPITSILFMDKWFTNIDPIGGLTAGVPVLMYESEKWIVSDLLWVKFILIALFFWIIFITFHGFCRFICPVGALMAPLNKISIQDIRFYKDKCTKCMKCIKSCPMRINILKMKRDMECTRCGRCVDACKFDAMHMVVLDKIVK